MSRRRASCEGVASVLYELKECCVGAGACDALVRGVLCLSSKCAGAGEEEEVGLLSSGFAIRKPPSV